MSRKYEQTKRAEQQNETRRRIARAAVELHSLVGPARTTVSAVADRAGVQRNTFYRHFPDDRSLMAACSALFDSEHPLPDPRSWVRESDPTVRAESALSALYAYWDQHESLIGNVLRDAETDDIVREAASRSWGAALTQIRDSIVGPLDSTPRKQSMAELIAFADLAISFRTWRTLVRDNGLTSQRAAALMASHLASEAF
ncbi:MAG TPA: helix-turn-helix domain-containing protein [Actinomycetes bacterium]|nr:helix-turn-helix domain-containing protein [Actinomycetes bacterium]